MEKEKLDLDELFRLAKEDPEEFEERRLQLINDAINSASVKNIPRLRGLQWRLDHERRVFRGGHYQFVNWLFGEMWDGFLDLNAHLQGFQSPVLDPGKTKLTLVKPSKD